MHILLIIATAFMADLLLALLAGRFLAGISELAEAADSAAESCPPELSARAARTVQSLAGTGRP
jgi:hypothetical protein